MSQSPTPTSSLAALRIIWLALILGPLVFAGVVMKIGAQQGPKSLPPVFLYIDVAMLASMVPIAYVVRWIIYRGGRTDGGTVTPSAYGTGNILFWAMCEGSAFFSLVCAMLNGGKGTPFLLAGMALAVQIANFPTGRPMREA
jgi:hypothetical protein